MLVILTYCTYIASVRSVIGPRYIWRLDDAFRIYLFDWQVAHRCDGFVEPLRLSAHR